MAAQKDNELPKGWTQTKISEICGLVNGRAFKPTEWASKGLPIIRIQNLNNKNAPYNYCDFPVDTRYLVEDGQLLFAWSGTPGTSFGAHIWKGSLALLNQHIFKVQINEALLSKLFLMYLFNNNVDEYIGKAHGTAGLAHITKGKFESSLLSLPPFLEQHRIVAKIEELFTDLDAGVAGLKQIKVQLNRYRQAVLKAAFEGKLTEEWRKKQGRGRIETGVELLERIREERKKRLSSKYKEPAPIDASEFPELPEGWVWTSMESISSKIVDGVHKKPNYTSDGIPFITVKNLTASSKIDFDNVRHISLEDHHEFIKRANPERGDILISKDGTLGVTRVVKTDEEFSIFVSVAMVKPIQICLESDFIAYFFSSPVCQKHFDLIGEGSGLQHLHLEDLRSSPVVICPIAEQRMIVSEIERLFSVADAIEKTVEKSLAQSERLRQSILKKAFEGKLVPQDPSDPPASELLQKINVEHRLEPIPPRVKTRKDGPAKRIKRDKYSKRSIRGKTNS